jgi:hypothetical protein
MRGARDWTPCHRLCWFVCPAVRTTWTQKPPSQPSWSPSSLVFYGGGLLTTHQSDACARPGWDVPVIRHRHQRDVGRARSGRGCGGQTRRGRVDADIGHRGRIRWQVRLAGVPGVTYVRGDAVRAVSMSPSASNSRRTARATSPSHRTPPLPTSTAPTG